MEWALLFGNVWPTQMVYHYTMILVVNGRSVYADMGEPRGVILYVSLDTQVVQTLQSNLVVSTEVEPLDTNDSVKIYQLKITGSERNKIWQWQCSRSTVSFDVSIVNGDNRWGVGIGLNSGNGIGTIISIPRFDPEWVQKVEPVRSLSVWERISKNSYLV